jgi:hypothetical protein
VIVKEGVDKWNYPIQNPLLFVTEPRTLDKIEMDLREIFWCDMYSIDVAQDRDKWRALVNTVMNLRVP